MRYSAKILLALFVLGLVAPSLVYPVFLMKLMCFALFACGFNLLLGYTGLLSFGHAALFGCGAYTAGFLMKNLGLNPEIGILGAVLLTAIIGYVFIFLARGHQGIYFAMVTLSLAQLVYFAIAHIPSLGGENGLTAIPRAKLFGLIGLNNDISLYYLVLLLTAGGSFLVYRVIYSPFGQVLRGIRDNEPRMISLGYDVRQFKNVAFVISAGICGLAGALKAIILQLATLTDVSWTTSGEVVLMTLIGGIGTIVGPFVGAAVIFVMENYLVGLGAWIVPIQGAIFFVIVLSFRRGIVGEFERYVAKRKPADQLEGSPSKP